MNSVEQKIDVLTKAKILKAIGGQIHDVELVKVIARNPLTMSYESGEIAPNLNIKAQYIKHLGKEDLTDEEFANYFRAIQIIGEILLDQYSDIKYRLQLYQNI